MDGLEYLSPQDTAADSPASRALQVIRDLLKNPKARWLSYEQRIAIEHALAFTNDMLVIMLTGGGKTMIPLVCARLQPESLSVVVLPLKSLIDDYERKLKAMGMEYQLWNGNSTRITPTPNLVLVSADRVRTDAWKKAIAEHCELYPKGRYFYDEGHMAFTAASYRPALRNIYEIRSARMQFIVMSATIPLKAEPFIIDTFNLVHPIKIRTPTDRPEIRYLLEKYNDFAPVQARAVELVNSYLPKFQPKERALIFCAFLQEGHEIAKKLNCDFYHAGHGQDGFLVLSPEEKTAMFMKWVRGETQVLVCSCALGTGNDWPHVRLTIHINTPFTLVDFAQQAQRNARDGKPGDSYVLALHSELGRIDINIRDAQGRPLDASGRQAMHDMVWGIPRCLRYQITYFCDGVGVQCAVCSIFIC